MLFNPPSIYPKTAYPLQKQDVFATPLSNPNIKFIKEYPPKEYIAEPASLLPPRVYPLKEFLDNNHVLRFYAVWKDESQYGQILKFVIHSL